MKRYTPIFYLIMITVICIALLLLSVGILLLFVEVEPIRIICLTICCMIVLIYPIALYKNRENASIIITKNTIEDYINDKTDNFGWIEEIENIKSIKITTREECQKYYKNCHSKKVILIDFGNGNVKYIALTWFTKRQSEKIVQTINERLNDLKNTKK